MLAPAFRFRKRLECRNCKSRSRAPGATVLARSFRLWQMDSGRGPETDPGIDVHAASCTLAVISEKGRKLDDFVITR